MTHPLYFVEVEGQNVRGKWFLEFDRDQSRNDVIDIVREHGQRVKKVLEVVEDEGTSRDVTDDFKVLAGIYDNLSSSDFMTRSKARMTLAAFDRAQDNRKNYVETV